MLILKVLKTSLLKMSDSCQENTSAGSCAGVFPWMLRNIYKNTCFAVFKQMNEKFGTTLFRSSHSQIFFKTGVFKNFAIFIEKHLCWNLFLIKLQTWRSVTWLKRESITGVFCEYWEICTSRFFIEHFLWLLLIIHCENLLFKFQINKRVLLIEMMKVSSSQSKFIIKKKHI